SLLAPALPELDDHGLAVDRVLDDLRRVVGPPERGEARQGPTGCPPLLGRLDVPEPLGIEGFVGRCQRHGRPPSVIVGVLPRYDRARTRKECGMSQLVFLHGPGAGACADAFHYQVRHFPNSVAPTLPGHLEGSRCPDVERYTEWVRCWLWAQGLKGDLVLIGYTLGASIALQYGLDYPDEVKGRVLMTVAARPKTRAAGAYEMR